MPTNDSQYVFLLSKVYERVQRLGSVEVSGLVGWWMNVITLLYNILAKCVREVMLQFSYVLYLFPTSFFYFSSIASL